MTQVKLFTDQQLADLSEQVANTLKATGTKLVTAESCTGGWLAKLITDVKGSSHWYERGFVTYSNESKQEMLAVPATILEQHGAVSEQTVTAMAQGALQNSHAQLSVSITGIAGPGGGTADKPVGTVWFGWASGSADSAVETYSLGSRQGLFAGDRDAVRRQAVAQALQIILEQTR